MPSRAFGVPSSRRGFNHDVVAMAYSGESGSGSLTSNTSRK